MINLKLYIVAHSTKSTEVVNNLKKFLTAGGCSSYDLKVIDVLEKPDLAEQDMVFATPTLIKTFPEPAVRIIGDLSNEEKVLSILGLNKSKKASL